MSDQTVKGREFEQQAEKKLNRWSFFGSNYEDAGDLYEKAANHYKLAKSWDQAGSAYVKLAECHLKVGQKIRSVIVYMEEMITKCWQWRDGWVIGTNQDIKSG
ncbi:alpha-soluble NSF attachment protein 2-like isoform X4 [Rutidosis leptorrhynchoides]